MSDVFKDNVLFGKSLSGHCIMIQYDNVVIARESYLNPISRIRIGRGCDYLATHAVTAYGIAPEKLILLEEYPRCRPRWLLAQLIPVKRSVNKRELLFKCIGHLPLDALDAYKIISDNDYIPPKRRQLDGWYLHKLQEDFRIAWRPSKEVYLFLGKVSISPFALDLMSISEITKALVKHSQKSWPDTGECLTEFMDSRELKFRFLTKQSDYDNNATEITESSEKDYSLLLTVRRPSITHG